MEIRGAFAGERGGVFYWFTATMSMRVSSSIMSRGGVRISPLVGGIRELLCKLQ